MQFRPRIALALTTLKLIFCVLYGTVGNTGPFHILRMIQKHYFWGRNNFSPSVISFTGVKKITCPGARDKLNFRQDKHIFSPNVRRTSKKFSASLFDNIFRTSKLTTGQVKNWVILPGGKVKIFRYFYPCFKISSDGFFMTVII